MTTVQRDYIMRMIEMMGQIIMVALRQKKAGSFHAADQTLTDALLGVIPEQADLIEMVDERTAAALLANPGLIEAYCELLLERAEIKFILGAESESEDLQRRALRMFSINFSHEGKLTPNGHLLFGRLSGLELGLLLTESERQAWKVLEQASALAGLS